MSIGKVYLIGAGPGDPKLITLKARELLRKADIVIYDYLVNRKILDYAKKAKRINIAANNKKNYKDQDRINRLLVYWAIKGKIVARLKGGDPFIFGRGSEEALYLSNERIPFEVIPGITSGIAACETIGIPITHRGLASQAVFISGKEAEGKLKPRIDWPLLARLKGTLIFYMAVENLDLITKRLRSSGMPADASCCIIQDATMPKQKVIFSRLKDIAWEARQNNIRPPAIFVVSKTIDLYHSIKRLPLSGKRVVITRPKERQKELSVLLEDLGALVIEFPTVKIAKEPKINIPKLAEFNWLIFMSQTAAEIFFSKVKTIPKEVKIASIGAKTACFIRRQRVKVNLIPEDFSSGGLIRELRNYDIQGKKILILRSDKGDRSLVNFCKKNNCPVKENRLYRIELPNINKDRLLNKDIDLVIFTSAQAARNFAKILGKDLRKKFKDTLFASIGPVTSRAIREAGFRPHIEAKTHTIKGLVEAIGIYFREKPWLT